MNIAVSNIRLGFATNSSSTHSIIVLNKKIEALPKGKQRRKINVSDQMFGWENFTLSDPKQKMEYLGQQIRIALPHLLDDSITSIVAETIVNRILDDLQYREHIKLKEDGYVDHQSSLPVPGGIDGHTFDTSFLKDFAAFLLRDDVLILGGNDNDTEDHPLKAYGKHVLRDLHYANRPTTAKKDGDYWTLFNTKSGTKIRLSFNPNAPAWRYNTVPDLIDLKITNRCNQRCPYCYQNSNAKDTREVDYKTLHAFARFISDWGYIQEIAVGGGEITLLNDLSTILYILSKSGRVLNITTRNMDWLTKIVSNPSQHQCFSKIGFTVENSYTLKQLYLLLVRNNVQPHDLITIHIPVGCISDYQIQGILDHNVAYGFPVLLLDYKVGGRALPQNNKNQKNMLQYALKVNNFPVGIDTAMAARYEKFLKRKNISEVLYSTEEGRNSLYIDLVDKVYGRASHLELYPFKEFNEIKEGYLRWNEEASK